MRIPLKFQIFSKPVVLSDKDVERLTPALAGYPSLQNLILQEETPASDLERLIVMEMAGRKRTPLLERLAARLGRSHQRDLRARIQKALR